MLPSKGRRSQTLSPVLSVAQIELFKKSEKTKHAQVLQPSSSLSPQQATRKQGKLQRKKQTRREALANKFLRLGLANYSGSIAFYFLLSFKAIALFGLLSDDEGSEGEPSSHFEFQKVLFPSSDDGNCFKMGCGTAGSRLYLLGGLKRENDGPSIISETQSKHAPRCSVCSKVFMLDFANSTTYEATEGGEMLSGKVSPLIMTVEDKLYVLATTPLPDCPFEVHDPKNNSWKRIPSPPFVKPDDPPPQIKSYVVINKKIHLSTSSSSFSFDTTTGKWTPCTLFLGHHQKLCRERWIDIQYPTHFGWIKYSLNSNRIKQDRGLPFDFHGEAVMYGADVMICLVPSRAQVVAYNLVDDKVVDTQVLEGLEIPPDATSSYLASLGKGYFCLLNVSNNDQPKQDCQIFITPFEVSRVKYELRQKGETKKFLNCLAGKKLIYSPPSTEQHPFSGEIWSPIGCFIV